MVTIMATDIVTTSMSGLCATGCLDSISEDYMKCSIGFFTDA